MNPPSIHNYRDPGGNIDWRQFRADAVTWAGGQSDPDATESAEVAPAQLNTPTQPKNQRQSG